MSQPECLVLLKLEGSPAENSGDLHEYEALGINSVAKMEPHAARVPHSPVLTQQTPAGGIALASGSFGFDIGVKHMDSLQIARRSKAGHSGSASSIVQ